MELASNMFVFIYRRLIAIFQFNSIPFCSRIMYAIHIFYCIDNTVCFRAGKRGWKGREEGRGLEIVEEKEDLKEGGKKGRSEGKEE